MRTSLFKENASGRLVNKIIRNVIEGDPKNIPTKDIYKIAYRKLKRESSVLASRYYID